MSSRGALADRSNDNTESSRLLLSSCKGESHTAKAGFKQLSRRLRSLYKTDVLDSKDDFTLKTLSSAAVVVFGNPQQKFTAAEFDVVKSYIGDGGSVLILGAEGGEDRSGTNINYLTEEFGININNDSVVRLSHHKYMHPKEALVTDGVLNRGIVASIRSAAGSENQIPALLEPTRTGKKEPFDGKGASFVYAHGATLAVQRPSATVLSTGRVTYPMHRPLGTLLPHVPTILHKYLCMQMKQSHKPACEREHSCSCRLCGQNSQPFSCSFLKPQPGLAQYNRACFTLYLLATQCSSRSASLPAAALL